MGVLFPLGEKLPEELQEMIFGYLGSDMVLESRLVCKDWKNFVDLFMEPKIWKPYFAEHHVADMHSYFLGSRSRAGTRFTSSEQMEQMMGDYFYGPLNYDESQYVESTCRTLILQCRTVAEYTGLCEVLPAFVARFGYAICNLVYFVHDKVSKSVTNISTIIAEMTNIQSLVIYSQCWSTVDQLLKKYLSSNKGVIELPNNLKSVTILGDVHQLLFPKLFSSHRHPNVKQLKLCGLYCAVNVNEMVSLFSDGLLTFPNVEELKICNLTYPVLLALPCWPLKRLSVKMGVEEVNCKLNLGEVLESIQKFAGTLESFHLKFKKKEMSIAETYRKTNLVFPKIHDLRVPYCTGMMSDYLKELKRIFPNIKHLQFVDNENEVHQMAASNLIGINDPHQLVMEALTPLWEQLPEGLEKMSVRYRNYNYGGEGIAARRYSYITQKYFQKKPDTSEEDDHLNLLV